MAMNTGRRISPFLAAAGLLGGLLTESVLILVAQSRAVEGSLREDFRVVAALESAVDAESRAVAEERLLALPGTESADYVSAAEAIETLAARDPSLPQSVALVGENPIPGFFKVRLAAEHIVGVEDWVKAAEAVPELSEISYSASSARAIVQLQFYARWLSLVLSAAASIVAFAAAGALWGGWRSGRLARSSRAAAADAAVGAAGWAVGALGAAALARPALAWAAAWPSFALHAAGFFLAGLAAFAWRLRSESPDEAPGRGRERRAVAGVMAALMLLPAVGAQAASVARQKRELEKLSRELESLRQEAERYREEAGRAERDLSESAKTQRRLESKISALRRELDDAEGNRRTLGGRLATLDAARADARRLLARELGDYSRRADLMAASGTAGVLEDAVRRGALRAKTVYLGGVRVTMDRTATEHVAAQRHQATLRRKTESQLSELEKTRRSKEKAQENLEEKNRRVGEAEARIAALEESRRALTSLVRDLEKKESRAAQAGYRADPPIKPRSLPWPVAGKVVSGFGKRRVPELGTWSVHNGVEIAASAGTAVHPVSPGEVIFSGPFRSYGNVVIINHGGGFYSIYGHLEGPLQAKGTRASTGAAVGKAAGQGSVYLELRQAGRALDPLRWLKP